MKDKILIADDFGSKPLNKEERAFNEALDKDLVKLKEIIEREVR